MTKHRYGKFSDMQMSEIKKTLRGSIFFLLQCADPNTSNKYPGNSLYDHIFDTYTEYERVLEENGLENGKVDSSMQFVRNKYLELMEKSFKQ